MSNLIMTGAAPDELWPLVRDFHYSRLMPSVSAIRHSFALREPGGLFGDTGGPVAGAIYGYSANQNWPGESIELQRLVRQDSLDFPLSSFLTWTLRWLRANTENTFAFSYADTAQDHHGGVYQASGWKFVNKSKGDISFLDAAGNRVHGKTAYKRFGTRSVEAVLSRKPEWSVVRDGDKLVYIFPLRRKWHTLARLHGWSEQPFPKPHFAARLLDASGSPACEPGANPGGRSTINKAAA